MSIRSGSFKFVLLLLGIGLAWSVLRNRSESWATHGRYFFSAPGDPVIRLRVRPDVEYRGIGGDLWWHGEHSTVHGEVEIDSLVGSATELRDAHSRTNALLSGQFEGNLGVFNLTSTSPLIGSVSLRLPSNCRELVREDRRSCRFGRYGASRTVTTTMPDVGAPFLASKRLLSHLDSLSAQIQAEFNQGFWGVVFDGFKMPGASYDWTAHHDFELVLLTENLLSIRLEQYEFTGGAHGNSGYRGLNFFALDANVLQPFGLADLFPDGSEGVAVSETQCLESLRNQGAAFVVDGMVDSLDLASDAVLTLSWRGLVYHFAPYSVGPYVQGGFRVEVPGDLVEPFLPNDALGSTVRRLWDAN